MILVHPIAIVIPLILYEKHTGQSISMTETYKGNCHCGQIKFDLQLQQQQPLRHVFSCSCSICVKKGYLWLFPEQQSQFQITSGREFMARYSANDRSGGHFFCPVCGTGIMAKDHIGKTIAVNARALSGVNPFTLKVQTLDSPENRASVSASFQGELPKVEDDSLNLYTGGCHCDAITLAVKLKPLPEVEVKEDNCSICQRNANICIYPHRDNVSIRHHDESEKDVTEYLFWRKFNGHCFCRICGVHVYMKLHGPPKSVVDNLPAEKQKMVQEMLAIVPVRLAVLDGVEWSDCHVKRTDEGTVGYE